jgi:hypothetical protein
MRKQVEAWQRSELTDVTAMVVVYDAFVEGQLEATKDRVTLEMRRHQNAKTGLDGYPIRSVAQGIRKQPSVQTESNVQVRQRRLARLN